MERALRLEVASQKSLHGVYDGLAEKSMRRFSMVACYHFKRIAPGGKDMGLEGARAPGVSGHLL